MPAPTPRAGAAPKRPRPPGHRRRPRHWWEQPIGYGAVLGIVVVTLLGFELAARSVSSQLPPHRGAEQEVDVKREQLDGHDPVDVAFAGASTVDVGLDPEVFDEASQTFDTSYNAGLKGMPITVLPDWLRLVDREVQPKVVVVDLQPTQLVINKGELAASYQQQVASFSAWVDAASGGAGAEADRRAGESSTLVEDRQDLRRPSLVARAALDAVTGKEAEPLIDADTREFVVANTGPTGRNLEYRDVPAEVSLDPGGAQSFDTALAQGLELGDTRDALEEIIDMGIPVVLTVLPIDVATLSSLGMSKERYEAAVASIRELADDLDLPLVEFPELTDPGLFHDKVHLADPGAAAASQQLAAKIDELCATGLDCT